MENVKKINPDMMAERLTALLRSKLGYTNLQLREFVCEAGDILVADSFQVSDQAYQYYEPTRPRLSPGETNIIIKSLKDAGISEDIIRATLPRIQLYSNKDMGKYLKDLLAKHGITPYRVSLDTGGLDDGYIREVIRSEVSISKEYIFAIALYLKLSMEEVAEFMAVDGLSFNHSIQDELFQVFIKSENYDLDEYVKQCRVVANQADVKLPQMFYSSGWS